MDRDRSGDFRVRALAGGSNFQFARTSSSSSEGDGMIDDEPRPIGPVWICEACRTGVGECTGWSDGWCVRRPSVPMTPEEEAALDAWIEAQLT